MTRSSRQRLLPVAPAGAAVRPARRSPAGRPASSEETRQALVDVAEVLFAEQGYGATSLEAIATAAEVTKGALYHHFSGKQALFEAALDRAQARAAESVTAATRGRDGRWEQAAAGLHAFVRAAGEPAYRRLVVQQGPAVLGYERFREREDRTTFAAVAAVVHHALQGPADEPRADVVTPVARLVFGAVSAVDAGAVEGAVDGAVGFVLASLRALVERPEAVSGT